MKIKEWLKTNEATYDYNLTQRFHPLFCTYICYNSGSFNVYLSSRLWKFHTRVFISRIYVFKGVLTLSFNVLFRCGGSLILEYLCSNLLTVAVLEFGYLCME